MKFLLVFTLVLHFFSFGTKAQSQNPGIVHLAEASNTCHIDTTANACTPTLMATSVQPMPVGLQMKSFFTTLLETGSWPPRWQCGEWTSFHGWLYIGSDLLIWLAYFAIPSILAFFVYQRKSYIPFRFVFILFIGFILACGLTHLIDALIFWWPAYRFSALIRFITASVSLATVFALVKIVPKALELKSPDTLEKIIAERTRQLVDANEKLENEILQRQKAELELKQLNEALEEKVREKTQNLASINEELYQANQLMESLQKHIQIGVWQLELSTKKIFWSDEVFAIHELPIQDSVNIEEGINFFHPDHQELIQEAVEDAIAKGKSYDLELKLITHKKNEIWVRAIGIPIINEGKTIGIKGVFQNIDSSKRTEEELRTNIAKHKALETTLRESEERFRLALEYSPIGIALVNVDGQFLKVNKALGEIVGYSEEELLNLDFQTITHPDDLEPDITYVQQLLSGTLDTYQIEKRYFHKNGQSVWIQLNGSIVRNEAKESLYFIAQIQDITRRKYAEMEITRMNKMLKTRSEKLEALNKELESFSYSVSHDLRAPLRSIAGYAQILQEDYSPKLDDEGNKTLRTIIKNARKMGQLIDDLLEFSRLGRKGIEKRKINMNTIVESVVQELLTHEQNRVINIKTHPLEEVTVDVQMIKQVWVNLISNAIKYSRKTEIAEIEIGGNTEAHQVCFFIRDNGVGFNMDYKDKLFNVFQRLHSAEEFEGTGVGLALVKRIVERHSGKLWAEAKENEGATFYFTIPK